MPLWSRIANVFRGDRVNREIAKRQSHIAEAIREGRDPGEARRAFGSALSNRERSRDIRLIPWLETLCADAVLGLAAASATILNWNGKIERWRNSLKAECIRPESLCGWTKHGGWGGLRPALQQRPPEQRGWPHHAEGHDGRASAGDPRREGSEVGGGAKAAANSSAAGCMIRLGATVREAARSLPLIGRTPLASSKSRRDTAKRSMMASADTSRLCRS